MTSKPSNPGTRANSASRRRGRAAAWNTKYFGDKGLVKAAQASSATIPKDQKAAYGQEANRVKAALTEPTRGGSPRRRRRRCRRA